MNIRKVPGWAFVVAGIAALAGCAAPPPAPVAPPPQIAIPPRPTPPMGSATNLTTPPVNALGVRETVNLGLTQAQTTWNLRSALNVAALNCLDPQYAPILTNYGQFLDLHEKSLRSANKELDAQFRERHGKTFIPARETYQTQVYNYFALPPTLPAFCDQAMIVSQEAAAIPAGELDMFAMTALPRIDSVFLEFFNDYDRYRREVAMWDAQYNPATPVIALPPSTVQASAPDAGTTLAEPGFTLQDGT